MHGSRSRKSGARYSEGTYHKLALFHDYSTPVDTPSLCRHAIGPFVAAAALCMKRGDRGSTVAASIAAPIPMVDDTYTLLMYFPLAPSGLAFPIPTISARMFSSSASAVKFTCGARKSEAVRSSRFPSRTDHDTLTKVRRDVLHHSPVSPAEYPWVQGQV
jgi:hypothetical protein